VKVVCTEPPKFAAVVGVKVAVMGKTPATVPRAGVLLGTQVPEAVVPVVAAVSVTVQMAVPPETSATLPASGAAVEQPPPDKMVTVAVIDPPRPALA